MKQTAVEWVVKEFDLTSESPIIKNVVEQAEEIFKQQIMDAFYEGMNCQNFDPNKGRSEIYYNETFKNKMKLELENSNEPQKQPLLIADLMAMLPSVDDAGVIAVNVASNVKPKLTAQEEAMFIAGFQECVKYLSMQGKGN
jgi:hypothetical protein